MANLAALTFPQVIQYQAEHSKNNENLLTFVDLDTNGEYIVEKRSYRQLWDNAQKIASKLCKQGVKKGDVVGLYLQNHPEFIESVVALGIVGAIACPIDPRTTGSKLQYMLEHTGCKGLITASYGLTAVKEILKNLSNLSFIWHLEDCIEDADPNPLISPLSTAAFSAGNLEISSTNLDDPMAMLFTSGSTGNPKAVVVYHKRYSGVASTRAQNFGVTNQDIMYTGLSLTHGNAFNVSLGMCLYSEIPLVISRKFTKSKLWKLIKNFNCSTINLLGGMFNTIYADKVSREYLDNHLRLIIGAGMPKQLWQAYIDRFKVDILEFYGAVEGGLMINRPNEGPIGSIGKPAPTLIAKIVDECGTELPANTPGNIVFANKDGTPCEVHYFNNPEASANKTKNGYLWMGDIGYKDNEGFFYFLYRDGGSIRKNGEFISSTEIEKVIAEYIAVQDVFVFGVESTNGVAGEQDVVAAIELVPGAKYDQHSFYHYCRQHLEKSHMPTYIQIFGSIPKTSAEKPLISIIKKEFSKDLPNVHEFNVTL